MVERLEIVNAAVSLLVKAALLATRFAGRVGRRSLKRLAATDTDAKAKEILFLKDRVHQLEMQVSIAVTERVIKTLKYEWLRCVPIIKGFDHLTSLCTEFERWYNGWRPHMMLEGLRPDDLYYYSKPNRPQRDAKVVPDDIERHVFAGTRLTGYRLKNAA
jgi:hypothetical protein